VAKEDKKKGHLVLPPIRLVTTVARLGTSQETAVLLAPKVAGVGMVVVVEDVLVAAANVLEGVASIVAVSDIFRQIAPNLLGTNLATVVARKGMFPRIAPNQGLLLKNKRDLILQVAPAFIMLRFYTFYP